jgi:excisionase family DNA binding protein
VKKTSCEHCGGPVEKIGWTIAECAQALGVSETTIRRNVADGSLKAVRFGSRVVILSQSVNDAIARALESPEDLREIAEAERIAAEDHAYNEAQHTANLAKRREALEAKMLDQRVRDEANGVPSWRMTTDPKTGQVTEIEGQKMALVNAQ